MSSSGYVSAAVTANAGGGQANATAINAMSSVTQVSVCATAGDSVKLPNGVPVGNKYTVINNGAALCYVYPTIPDNILI